MTSATNPAYHYTAYGVTIGSPIPLTEFVPAPAGNSDLVVVRFGSDSGWIPRVREQDDHFEIVEGEARFWFRGVGGFVVQDGREIVIIPEPGADQSLMRLYVEGMMMAMVLHQRGRCVVHASVVEIDGYAIAFLGNIGAGKSSTAAALYARGYRIIADDNAALELGSGFPAVWPGYPSVKLFPSIATALGFTNGALSVLHPSQAKLAGSVVTGFCPEPLPLKRFYILGREYESDVAHLSPLEAVVELIRNTVPTRWGHRGDARQLRQCAHLANQVPAYQLRTFSEPASLPLVAHTVERHCEQEEARCFRVLAEGKRSGP